MACTHARDCPLFPKLKSSLAGWRTHYCDTDSAWKDCARYTYSLKGKPAPLALLPNGKMALALEPGTTYAAVGEQHRQPEPAKAPDAGSGHDDGGRRARTSWWARLLELLRRTR